MAALALVIASTVMLARVFVEVAVVHPPVPLVVMSAAGLLAVGVLLHRLQKRGKVESQLELGNPVELGAAIRFGLLFAGALWISKAAEQYAGAAGLYAAAALAGTTDVDAITLSTANLARSGLEPRVAVTAILVGAVSNTLVKAIMAGVLGGWELGRRVAIAFGAMLAAAVASGLVLWLTG
jgi:uncharacterized membrane protein (DUF4010 family)